MGHVITLELNELNFDLVEKYAEAGDLPTFRRLRDRHHLHTTVAEKEFSNLEPWIQWVTAHTGLRFSEHNVFRLGDIVGKEIRQIWDVLESDYGLTVGAISPMNASNTLKNPAFFVPDPWTNTSTVGSTDLVALSNGLKQAVNDNARKFISLKSYLNLAYGAALNASPKNYIQYFKLAKNSGKCVWRKALLLDLLLSDAFIRHARVKKPNYATLFLNAGAHIQHHYMFSSRHYTGNLHNPSWYVPKNRDPVGEVYKLYDHVIGQVLDALPETRVLICTGLSQRPNPKLVHYYRPKDHPALVKALGVQNATDVEPRMSRDFLVTFPTDGDAKEAESLLAAYRAADGDPIFRVDNRGNSLFCMLMYTKLIGDGFTITGNGRTLANLDQWVTLVSIENSVHRTEGFFVDCGDAKSGKASVFPIEEVFQRTIDLCTARS